MAPLRGWGPKGDRLRGYAPQGRWRTLTFRCTTHSAGGVTMRDIDLARRIDEIVRSAR